MLRMISYSSFPPGQWSYVEVFPGGKKIFGGGYSFTQQSDRIAEFRKANGLPREKRIEAMEDLENYTIARISQLPGSKEWIFDTDQSFAQYAAQPGSGCGSCGIRVS